jgi:hypothetical protein
MLLLLRFPCLWNQTYLQSSITVINGTITSASLGRRRAASQKKYSFGLDFDLPRILQNLNLDRGLLMRLVVIERGIIAGLVATAALSAMLMKQSMGLTPELDLIAVITAMAGASSPVVGWIGHFVIGAVFWEVAFAIVSPYLPDPLRFRGPIFASRIAKEVDRSDGDSGAGVFARSLGMMAPVTTLVLHVLCLAALGGVDGFLNDKQTTTTVANAGVE